MGIFRNRPGTRYDGPVSFSTDYSLVPRPGYYALTADGRKLRRPYLRLVAVDDAPGDQYDGACHYEVAGRRDPVQRWANVVPLEAHAEGVSELGGEV